MVRPTLAISEDVLHVRTADVWMGWCPPNRLKRGGFLGLLLGHQADLPVRSAHVRCRAMNGPGSDAPRGRLMTRN